MPEPSVAVSKKSRGDERRFIHAADLHLDSQLKGLEAYEGAPVDRLRNATRVAFENLIALAIDEQVDFVVIAGDLFDGKWTDQQTGLWTAAKFRQLERAGIDVYLIRGNHDAAAEVRQRVQWPPNVHEFPTDAPGTFLHEPTGIALHGQGFSQRETTIDLAAGYPLAIEGKFNVGLLHTSLTGDPNHDSYAPTREETLVSKGYDYWALGHIHTQRRIRERPFIAYSGCTQGRHIHESGVKGCFLVTVRNEKAVVQFRELDAIRWQLVEATAPPEGPMSELYDVIRQRLEQARASADGRFVAVRLVVTGQTACHRDLNAPNGHDDAVIQIRDLANSLDQVWVEKIQFQTQPRVDVARLRESPDLLGELLRSLQALTEASDEELVQTFKDETSSLGTKAGLELRECDINLSDPELIRRWLCDAENLLVARLAEPAGETASVN